MSCIEKIYSVSALVGSNKCNANCSFCSAEYLRKDAEPKMPSTFESAIKLSARYGGWSLSLTGSGEPTMSPDSVTEALCRYKKCADQGAFFPNVNLFSNGILLSDSSFCDTYLPIWKNLGLTSIAISIHHPNKNKQAYIYNIKDYPDLSLIEKNIHKHNLQCRATLLLQKGYIDNASRYKEAVDKLIDINITNITSWCIGNPNGSYNKFSPSFWSRNSIKMWLALNTKKCHGHSWGGGVSSLY